MQKKRIFTGIATALITPFKNGEVDYDSFGKFIDWQIDEGIDALVGAGTTGEGSTLTDDEHVKVIEYTVDRANGKVPVIAGTGSNDTLYAINLTKTACKAGVDGVISTNEYGGSAVTSIAGDWNIIGTTDLKIKYIGYPSLWLRDIFIENQKGSNYEKEFN